ncbi:uncharacterized protein LOC109597950 [Aethina tumida]|uniref:uncharacterized protein LOC109597950 n=1 Tax=Aethina tumida TaxID=116153 RepID=UPI002149333B|nr:uncharacterized protein LOC109597950 [Aethina tumida]
MASLTRRVLLRGLRCHQQIRLIGGNANIVSSHCSDVQIDQKTVQEFIYPYFEKFSRFTAVECGLTGRKYTYEQLRKKCRNLSKNLRTKLKLNPKDVVAVHLPNIPEFPIVTLGCLEAGTIVTSLNPIYTPDEVARQLKDSSAKAVVTTVESIETVKQALSINKTFLPIIAIKTESNQAVPQGIISFNDFTDTEVNIPDFHEGNHNETTFLPYSSGTTGLPKGVMLSHRNIVANLEQIRHPSLNFLEEVTDSHQDVIPAVLPFFHIYGFTVTMLQSFIKGVKLVTIPKFTPENYVSVLENNKVTVIYAAPPLILFLTNHPMVEKRHLQHLKNIMSGAAPLGSLDEEKFLEKADYKVNMIQGYGLTETSPVVSTLTKELQQQFKCAGSIGLPLPNTQMKLVAIDDPTGTPLGPNQQGELYVKGPQVMQGYFNKPKETDEVFHEGWFKTGDLMYYDENKLFYVTDRLKELIKVKGFQVAPAELEELLRNFPNVSDAAVIGIPDMISGELPRAYVVPKANAKINTDELYNYVAEKVAPYKKLKGGIEVRDSIPKNASGKIMRRQLKLEYLEQNPE